MFRSKSQSNLNQTTPMIKQTKFHQRLRGLLLAAITLLSVTQFCQAQSLTIVPFNQTWNYNQTNTDLLTAWREPGYDASGWPSGAGPLGFPVGEALTGGVVGDTGLSIQTVLSRFMQPPDGATQVRTYYFQTKFVFTNDPVGVTLISSNLIDDAAVFFLNGVEIGRVAFPPPPEVITHASQGSRGATDVITSGWDVFTNVPSNLIQGTNVLAVEVHQTGGASSDLVFAHNLTALIPAPVVITAQPANQTVAENRVVNITVGVSGTPTPTFQWYKDLSAILDATNQTFTIANSAIADTGNYFVVASNPLNVVTSSVARLTVVVDTNGPVLLSMKTDDTFQKIFLTWNETMAQGSVIEVGNYYIFDSLSNRVDVTSVDYNGSNAVLHVPTLQPGATYAVEITFQSDLVGNLTAPVGVPTVDPANGVVTSFYTWVFTRGFTRYQSYLARPAGETLAAFVALPVYPDGSSFSLYTNLANWPQTVPNVENYVMRFSGLFIATQDGTYSFDPAHDDEMRLRVFSGEDPSGTFTEFAAACCTGLTGGPTLDVALVAGNRYYFELLVHEGGGGDYAGLTVTLPSTAVVSPINGQYLALAADPLAAPNVGISQQPQSITVPQNHTATFSVVATNLGGGASYQWQISTGGPFTDIAGAGGSTYTTPLRALTDSGHQYRVLVSVPGRTLTSAVATLTVIFDTFPPHIIAVSGSRDLNTVTVRFDEVMDAGTVGEVSNYELRDSASAVLTLTAPVISPDNRSVSFTTPSQTPGGFYTLSAQSVTDLAGNVLETTNVTFQTWTVSPGFIQFEAYGGGGGTAVSVLTGLPIYPNFPDLSTYIAAFDSRLVYPTDAREQYGARMSGLFLPPADGNYTFYDRSDDASELYLSTDASTANLVKIAEETGCCGAFSKIFSASIPLVGGQAYAIQLLYREGGGGDYGQVAVKLTSDPANPDTLLPIGPSQLAALADPNGASITITQQPASATFVIVAGSSGLLDQNLNSSDGGFTVVTPLTMDGPWAYNGGSGSWIYEGQGPDNFHPNTSILTTPANAVTALGNVVLTFSHRHSFEGGNWDGGQVRVSVNGGPFVAVPSGAFLQNAYNGTVLSGSQSELANQTAFVNDSVSHGSGVKITSICDLGLYNPGDQIRLQFFASSDTNTKGSTPNWEIDSVVLTQGNGAVSQTFRVGTTAANSSGPNPPRSYQWYRNNGAGFILIAGANAATYTLIPTLADNGAQFRVQVSIPGASITSSTATLTVVGGGTSGPTLRSSNAGGTVTLSWDAPNRLQYTTSLTPPINWLDVSTGGATTFTVTPANEFNVHLDTAQSANPSGGRTGTGRGTISLSNNVLKVNVVYSGLSASRTVDHFHAPAPRGANASVAYDIGAITTGTTAGTILGDVPLVAGQYGGKSMAAQIQDIRDGLWYLNIHSTAFGGGEIRGQVEAGARFYRLISP